MSYDINLKHLEYFIKVARLGSINKAAQMLYVSQSHLGKIIHDLEETVGAPLLNRSRQGVTLTPEGNEFLERSVRILKEMEGMHLRPLKEMEKTEPLAVSMTKFSHVMESFITIVRRYQDQPEFTHRRMRGSWRMPLRMWSPGGPTSEFSISTARGMRRSRRWRRRKALHTGSSPMWNRRS